MSEAKDTYGYPLKPRMLGPAVWFYEQRSGLCVCAGTELVTIPWRKLETAVDRHRALKGARR